MKKKTHDEYVMDVSMKNLNIDVIGVYVNSNTKITHKCKICGHVWEALPFNILKGSNCPKCANNKKSMDRAFTVDEYIDKLAYINPSIEFIGNYKNMNTRAMHRCKICDYKWMAYPNNVLNGKGCKKCFDKINADMRRKPHDVYVAQAKDVNDNIIVLGQYMGSKIPVKHKCKVCEHEWYAFPDSILHGHGCPKCMESHGEKAIEAYLKQHSINFEQQYSFTDCRNIKPLRFDFYLPEVNACIEYDGIQHFEPINYFGGVDAFEQRKKNDMIKTNYCLKNGIQLLRVRYNEDIETVLDVFLTIQN